MGVVLTPIIVKEPLTLEAMRGRRLAVDGHGELYQFLALIRLRDGTPLRDSHGWITSHLAGLALRAGDLATAYSKATMTSRLTADMRTRSARGSRTFQRLSISCAASANSRKNAWKPRFSARSANDRCSTIQTLGST